MVKLMHDDSDFATAVLTHANSHVLTDTQRQSKKMTKLLAALDLVQVGNIKLVETPEPGGACMSVFEIVGWLAVGWGWAGWL